MTLADVMDIATSGLIAQRTRLATVASNLANAQTTRTSEGGPYRRRDPVFSAEPVAGSFADVLSRQMRAVEVQRVAVDQRPPIMKHEPGHPDADEEGFVAYPRVNPVEELANMISASRSFEANLMLLGKAKQMGDAALQIGR